MENSDPLLVLKSYSEQGCNAICDLGKCRARGVAKLKSLADPYRVNAGEIMLEGRVGSGTPLDYSLKFSRRQTEQTYKFEYEFRKDAQLCRGYKYLSVAESTSLSNILKDQVQICERAPRTSGSPPPNPRRISVKAKDKALASSFMAYHGAPSFNSEDLIDLYVCSGLSELMTFADSQEEIVPAAQRVGSCPTGYADAFQL